MAGGPNNDTRQSSARHAHGRESEFPEYQDIIQYDIKPYLEPNDAGNDPATPHGGKGEQKRDKSECRQDSP